MHRIRIGVLRGGPSNEYNSSLNTGAFVLNNLSQNKYNIKDIFIDKENNWHLNGLIVKPNDILANLDIVFNALHGQYGEDGKVQSILESHNIPYTGSNSFSSLISFNKLLLKDFYNKNNIKTPKYKIVDIIHNIKEIIMNVFHSFPLPIVVKPANSSNRLGISYINNFDLLENAINEAKKFSDKVYIEEYIIGKDAENTVIENFRDQEIYALPVIGDLSLDEKKEIEKVSIMAHKVLGMNHYSNSNFIIHPKRGIFIIDTNPLPKFHENSSINQALNMVGISTSDFLDHIIELALSRK